ncbi:MAG: hypothetical protein ABFD07_04810 [Methanobacterium sp.]
MSLIGENISSYYTCRMCKGTGSKYYYYPINKRGDCPHCGGLQKLDWITNIKGVHWKVSIPKISEGDAHHLRTYEKMCKKYGEERIKILDNTHKFWALVFEDDRKEREEKIRKWENEFHARILEASNTIAEGV